MPVITLLASIGAFGSIFAAAFLHNELWSVAKVFLQYIFMLLTYVNTFAIYSFCNMHDISWGTKEGMVPSPPFFAHPRTRAHTCVALLCR